MPENVKNADEIIADIFKEASENAEISKIVLEKIKSVYDSGSFKKADIKKALSEIKEG
jgi:hypothetical protein